MPKRPNITGLPATASPPRLLYNARETCQLLGGISTRSLRRMVLRGLIRPTTLLRTNLFPLSEIQRLIDDNCRAIGSPPQHYENKGQ